MTFHRVYSLAGAVAAGIGLMLSPLAAQNGSDAANVPASKMPPPIWAFPYVESSGARPKPPDDGDKVMRVPNSDVTYTMAHIRDGYNALDWHPQDHPPMPEVVAHGRRETNVKTCGRCHLVTGQGRPENGPVGGLPAPYFIQQVKEFQSGARRSSDMRRIAPTDMVAAVKNMTDEDLKAAAEYFASVKFKSITKVVEAETIPKPAMKGSIYVVSETGEKEPLGERIIEVPDHVERGEIRDTHSMNTAYVPVGSIRKGEELANGGGGKTMKCSLCHGDGLTGLASTPPIAGRSPTYIVRALYDFQSGARHGASSPMMKGVVETLTVNDMIALAAYVSSLTP